MKKPMHNAESVQASEIENTEPETVSTDMSLSQIKTRMENQNLRAIPVVDGKKFKGVIGYRDLIRQLQFNPKSTKPSKVIHNPPEYEENDSFVDVCDLRINSGRKMLVRTDLDQLQGIIGDEQFRKASTEINELSNISTSRLASTELVQVFEDDSLEKARHKMLDNNISRLPVLDENGNLTGLIRSTDLLRTMIPMESQNAGGRSGDRSGTLEVNIAGGDEKEHMSDIPVKELMHRMVTNSENHMDAKEAAEMMEKQEAGEIIFVDDKYPEAIITVKDLIHHVKKLKASDMVLVNLIGLELPEEKAALHDKIKTQLRGSLGRKLDRPQEITVRIRKKDKDGKKHRYEFDVKLYSEYGITTVQADGWDMLEVMDDALDQLNSLISKKKGKRKEKRPR